MHNAHYSWLSFRNDDHLSSANMLSSDNKFRFEYILLSIIPSSSSDPFIPSFYYVCSLLTWVTFCARHTRMRILIWWTGQGRIARHGLGGRGGGTWAPAKQKYNLQAKWSPIALFGLGLCLLICLKKWMHFIWPIFNELKEPTAGGIFFRFDFFAHTSAKISHPNQKSWLRP